ncbi:hypothetical protein [Streptomyces tendae]
MSALGEVPVTDDPELPTYLDLLDQSADRVWGGSRGRTSFIAVDR